MLAVQADGADITTVEGLAAPDGTLHPVQQALRDAHGLQCGFCTPGVVMTLAALTRRCAAQRGTLIAALSGHHLPLYRLSGHSSRRSTVGWGAELGEQE